MDIFCFCFVLSCYFIQTLFFINKCRKKIKSQYLYMQTASHGMNKKKCINVTSVCAYILKAIVQIEVISCWTRELHVILNAWLNLLCNSTLSKHQYSSVCISSTHTQLRRETGTYDIEIPSYQRRKIAYSLKILPCVVELYVLTINYKFNNKRLSLYINLESGSVVST